MEKINKILNKKIKKYSQRIKIYIDYNDSNDALIIVDVYVNNYLAGFIMLDNYDNIIKLYSTHFKFISAEDVARVMLALAEALEVLNNDN